MKQQEEERSLSRGFRLFSSPFSSRHFKLKFLAVYTERNSLKSTNSDRAMAMTKNTDGIGVSIVLSTTVAIVFVLGFHSYRINKFVRFASSDSGVPIAELIAAATPRRDELKVVISSEFHPNSIHPLSPTNQLLL